MRSRFAQVSDPHFRRFPIRSMNDELSGLWIVTSLGAHGFRVAGVTQFAQSETAEELKVEEIRNLHLSIKGLLTSNCSIPCKKWKCRSVPNSWTV